MRRAAARSSMVLALVASTLGCDAPTEVPEAGAVLLRVKLKGGAPVPDELRVSVYDDGGALWRDVRVPEQGPLTTKGSGQLGTILIQPGETTGALRVHLKGWREGTRVLDGLLRIAKQDRGRGSFDVMLDAPEPADSDGDDVPDEIDDCAAIANPAQGGCPGGNEDAGAPLDAGHDAGEDTGGIVVDAAAGVDVGASTDAGTVDARSDASIDVGSDAPTDAGSDSPADTGTDVRIDAGADVRIDAATDAAPPCAFAGGCNLPRGTVCVNEGQCASSFCVDGVCCAEACAGKCRACNQPGNDGLCKGYAAATDPERECSSGMTCNGAGACGSASPPGNKMNGEICAAASECGSRFCKDGVCCNTACNNACESCSTGTCSPVTRNEDAPECIAPMRCNPSGKCVGI